MKCLGNVFLGIEIGIDIMSFSGNEVYSMIVNEMENVPLTPWQNVAWHVIH